MNYKKEYAWIRYKYSQGVTKEKLRDCVGVFSNKKKNQVMQQKNLSSKEYDKRNKFLSNVYHILSNY